MKELKKVVKYSVIFLAVIFVLAILTPEPKIIYKETPSCTIAKENNEVYKDVISLDSEAFNYIGAIFNNVEYYLLDVDNANEAGIKIENFGNKKTYLLNKLQ